MVDWLHCNTCFKQPGPTSDGRAYFLTSCGHVFCDRCQDKGWKQKCLFCGTKSPSTLKLTAKLTPPVDAYFSEPRKLMHQLFTDMKQLISTYEFQDDQRKRLVKWLLNNVTDKKHHDNEASKVLERENLKLKEENNILKKMLDERTTEINYFKRLLSEKSYSSNMRSPSADLNRIISPVYSRIVSPGNKGFGRTPSPSAYPSFIHGSTSSLSNYRRSPGSGGTSMTPGRVSVRLPPTGGKLGIIPPPTSRTPASSSSGYSHVDMPMY